MEKCGVDRLICISAGALYVNKSMGFLIASLTKLVLQRILLNIYNDMRIMEAKLSASDLCWTIVRPPMLRNIDGLGKYRIAVNSNIRKPFSIARKDLAHYMLNSLEDGKTFKAIVEIAY
jgi:hypothetical protein